MIRWMRNIVAGIVLGVSMLSLSIQPVHAASVATGYSDILSQGIIFAGICTSPADPETGKDECACRSNGDCSLDDVLQVFSNVAIFILGISGTVVLFAFVYGGFCWIFSHGESNWVERGKDTMIGAVIGLCIIFGSYVALNFIVSGLTSTTGELPATTNLEETVKQNIEGADSVFTTEYSDDSALDG
jgi:hypothetical protein